MAPTFLMVDATHYEVAYAINPWMAPDAWRADAAASHRAALASSAALRTALRRAGAVIETMEGAPGAPDLVFPANAAVVLDGRAILARFLHPERRVEEPIFARALETLRRRGLLDDVKSLPDGCVQEGAGDFIYDVARDLFWAGYGQRSDRAGMDAVATFFGRYHVPLRLATPRFYHLDTCFCPLPGGEVLYYPPAFTADALTAIERLVSQRDRLIASDEDAARFCVNAVAIGMDIVMADPTPSLRENLQVRGYRIHPVELSPFIASGGGAYCMTLRLDRSSNARAGTKAEDPIA